MRILSGKSAVERVRKLAARRSELASVEPRVQRIIRAVHRQGDRALRGYAEKWDGLDKRAKLRVSEDEMQAAWDSSDSRFRSSLRSAAANLRRFCEWQKPVDWMRTRQGISVGQVVRPLDSVGCYVPGGRYPLVSTLLMTVIPAQVAGVKTIRVVSPQPKKEVLAAAAMLGVREAYRVGGAPAIAALAYGTETIARVDKIVGPGNLYVTAAKKLVSFDCAIDFLAGPTEVVVLADSGSPEFIAADLVAQAEHDPQALAIFITTQTELATKVSRCIEALARQNQAARESLRANGVVLLTPSREQALDWANQIAPEHVSIEPENLPFIRNAGSVFVGEYSPQAAGDYASGPNHVLPTGGAARFRGGLSVLDFVKLISVQKISRPGLRQLAPVIDALAMIEGLQGHAESVRVRCRDA
ncbi:MAG TPA: histidinol dehydrogenase [Terriglobales bacterium]|nr:histidinol dehydrogenase [Terriglobales bacterium]